MPAIPSAALKLLSVDQLKELYDNAYEDFRKGKVTTTMSYSGKNVGSQLLYNAQDLMAAVSNELRLRDPDSYGAVDRRTVARFS
jgi:hypothetical protein